MDQISLTGYTGFNNSAPLNRLFVNTSESYKFFWFQAILNKVLAGKKEMAFEELVNEMIADAWYIVMGNHLKLGPQDAIEDIVLYISKNYKIKPEADKNTILAFLECCSNSEIKRRKYKLIEHVPYRLQAPFMDNIKGSDWKIGMKELTRKINHEGNLIYYFSEFNGMQTTITIQDEWYEYFHQNCEIVTGWLRYNMLNYIQRRNPDVSCTLEKLWQ